MSRITADASASEVESSVMTYATERGLKVTMMRIIKFWDTDYPTYTARLNVSEDSFETALDPYFWPDGVLVREWEDRGDNRHRNREGEREDRNSHRNYNQYSW